VADADTVLVRGLSSDHVRTNLALLTAVWNQTVVSVVLVIFAHLLSLHRRLGSILAAT
jgi:hypothetical protein